MPKGPRHAARYRRLDAATREALHFEVHFLEGVLSRRPAMLPALTTVAHAYTELGYYADGLEADRRICDLAPDDPVARYNLACSLALTDRPDDAIAALEEAWALGYRDADHMRRDADLASLHELPRFRALLRRQDSIHPGRQG